MEKSSDFTSGYLRDKCCNCTCQGHTPSLTIETDEDDCRYYLLNREQLNEFWVCTIGEQLNFCKKESNPCKAQTCQICRFVNNLYLALICNHFFDFDDEQVEQPVLWRVYTRFLDKKINPFLVKIDIAKRMK